MVDLVTCEQRQFILTSSGLCSLLAGHRSRSSGVCLVFKNMLEIIVWLCDHSLPPHPLSEVKALSPVFRNT